MSRTKKIISVILVSLLLALASLTLIACNKGGNATSTYTLLKKSLTTYMEGRMFDSGSNYGIDTNYNLKRYSSKNSLGGLVNDYSEHKVLLSIGLNFIEDK